ncbi:MAG: DUF4097 family beta strand repeat protein [Candidatus Eiseniibacteriota bacterium]|nr:MAG: DUF4097 family beta strand repeat protein [Candidatus Eisenbacteria bacterium]
MNFSRAIILVAAITVLALSVLPGVSAAEAAKYEETFERTEKLAMDGKVYLSNLSGNVTIVTWDRPDVKIHALKTSRAKSYEEAKERAELVKIEVKRSDGQLQIRTNYPERRIKKQLNVYVAYELTIPNRAHATVSNVSGNIEAQDLGALAKLDTVSGNVIVVGAAEGGVFSAVSGNVDLRDVGEDVNAKTVSGAIRLGKVSGTVNVEAVSGGVELTGLSDAQSANISVHSGDITFEGTLNRDGRYSFRNHSGSITLILPGDTSFDLNVKTFSGNLTSEFKVLSEFEGKLKQPRRDLHGEVNGGGADVTIETFSGNVKLKKAD